MKRVMATLVVVSMACAGADAGSSAADAVTSDVVLASAAVMPSGSAETHTVDMVLTAQGEYKFVPEELTIQSGDIVKWINVSGGPHNVKFYADKIPAGASDVLSAAMQGRTMTALEGMLMMAPNAEYEINFAGAPAGVYDYTCTPHTPLGMDAKLTIQ